MDKHPELVLLDQRIWYVPDGVFHLRCVARTSKKRRCQNPLEYGQTARWSQLRSTHGLISVYDLSILDDDATRRWMDQHCDLHDTPTTVDEVSPEWEPFDPVRHAAMITTLEEWVAQRERAIREGVTDRWDYWEMPYL
ncbi:hypothetical protein ACLQ2S_25080 [Micromonospora sp. DT48]|uniref:hypothetical protein n=1 Tax=Micromonospora sp. DT48 TaxID=3393429 RepID=UPI003CF504FA